MNTLSTATSLLAHALVYALLYSLWQGLLIYGMLFVLLKALPNVSAGVKYNLSLGALAALFLWFTDTWLSQYQVLKGTTVYITGTVADTGASTTYPVKAIAGEAVRNPVLSQVFARLEHYFSFIIMLYAAGLAFMLLRFFINVLQVRALRKQGIILPEPHWNDLILQWKKQFEITRPVKLFLSTHISSPIMLGVIRPVILLPVAAVTHLTTAQLEAILLHELAHIKRHDYLWNIFQAIAETILFFNPFVWLLSGIIRREREHCCDDLVVASAADPLPYAKALTILEGTRINEHGLALAATGHKNQLFHRIKRIMEMKKNTVNYSQLTIIIVAFLAITFTIAMFTFTPSFAQKVKKDASDTTKKNVYHSRTIIIDNNGKKTVTEKRSSTPPDDDNATTDVDVNASAKDTKDGKNAKSKTYSYTYSYSDDDLNKVMDDVKNIVASVTTIGLDEAGKEIEESRKEIDAVDWNEVRNEIDKGLDEVNKQLNDPELRKKINKEVKQALEKSKDAMEQAEETMKAMPPIPPVPPVPPAPPARPFDREEARNRSSNYEAMLKKMEKDGLIDRSDDYTVETENGALYINDKKQPEDTYRKYQQYLENRTVDIEYHNGILKITMHDD